MATKWHLYDIIDLDFLLTTQHHDDNDRHKSDRQWYLDHIDPQTEAAMLSEQEILTAFLRAKRQETHNLPGQLFREFSSLFGVITIVVSLLTGSALSAAALWYDGSIPVNVFRFLGLLLLPQLFFLLIMLIGFTIRKGNIAANHPSALLNLGRDVLLRLFFKLKKLSRVSSAMAQDKNSILADIVKKRSRLFFYPVFNFFQIFAIGFNIAALATLLIRIAGSDIAFGWQSTLQVSSDFLYRLTQSISIPWKYFFPDSLPTPEQIEGSRIILKEGISVLSNEALTSWWPFLFFTLLCYGLLPRIAVLLFGLISEKKLLRSFLFNLPEIKGLLRRMQTPYVSSAAGQQATSELGIHPQTQAVSPAKPATSHPHLLLSEDIQYDPDILQSLLQPFGFSPASTRQVEMYWENDVPHLPESSIASNILLLVQAWMPPIGDTLHFLEQLSAHYHDTTIQIGLIGKPMNGRAYTPPTSQDISIWQSKLESIEHTNLQLIALQQDTEDKEE